MQQLDMLPNSAPAIPKEVLEASSWLATRVRHVDVAIVTEEGRYTVNGRKYHSLAAAAQARRTLAATLVAIEQRYKAQPCHVILGLCYTISLDAMAGVFTVGSQTTTVRIVHCAACGDRLPRRCRVIVTSAGVIGVGRAHNCPARTRSREGAVA